MIYIKTDKNLKTKPEFYLLNVFCVLVKVGTKSFGRTFNVAEGSRMNVYILLDTSGSIKKRDFEISRNATISLIKKVCENWTFSHTDQLVYFFSQSVATCLLSSWTAMRSSWSSTCCPSLVKPRILWTSETRRSAEVQMMSSGMWWILTLRVGPCLFLPHSATGHL